MELVQVLLGKGDGDELWRMRKVDWIGKVLRLAYIRRIKCENFKFISGE